MKKLTVKRGWTMIPELESLEHGIFVDGFWDDGRFSAVMFDKQKKTLGRWIDATSRRKVRIQGRVSLPGYQHISHKMVNPLTLVDEWTTDLELESHQSPPDIRGVLGKKIDPVHDYINRNQLVPGAFYRITDRMILKKSKDKRTEKIRRELLGESHELVALSLENLPVLNSAVPDIPMVAFDIEVRSPRDVFPTPKNAEYEVHSVGISSNTGEFRVLILDEKRKLRKSWNTNIEGKILKEEEEEFEISIKHNFEVIFLDTEEELLLTLMSYLNQYPIVLTFNGDGFDCPYIYYRSKRLGIESNVWERKKEEWEFGTSIHIDLLRFLRKPSIRLYAFGGRYSSFTLDAISEALLGVKKVEHEKWFDEMSVAELVKYNLRDSVITLQLMEFNDRQVWTLLILLMRLGKMTLSYVVRKSISSWLLQWVANNHERMGYLLPEAEAILETKGGFESSAGIDGKQYEGAIVLHPKPGIWWDVIVYDFASLYPSIIKARNIGYDTIRCSGTGHEYCKENKVPGLTHWVCRRYTSIMASMVGYVRDLRVKWYKRLAKKETDPQKKRLYSMIQAALKVFINASYGVFGADIFPLFCPPAAETTTAFARDALLTFKNKVEKQGGVAVYGDTDSLFLHNVTKDLMDEIIFEMLILHGMELGIDYDFRVLFLTDKKKNYFGITKENKIIVKGLSGKKSNTPVFIREAFKEILEIYATVNERDDLGRIRGDIVSLVRSYVKRLQEETLELEKLAAQYSISQPLEEFHTKTVAVTLALCLCGEKPQFEKEVKEGMILRGVKSHPFLLHVSSNIFPNLHEKSGDGMQCTVRPLEHITSDQVDWKYYLKSFLKTISPLLTPLEINLEQEVFGQQTLVSYFGR